MNWVYITFLLAVTMPMVFGVPLLIRVKRQNTEETNELAENYPENIDQNNIDNQPDEQIVDQTYTGNDVMDQPPRQQPDAPMVGADNSPYRKYDMAPGYGDQEQPTDTEQGPAAEYVPPQEDMAPPPGEEAYENTAFRSEQPAPVMPASGQPFDAQGQYVPQVPESGGEGQPVPLSGEPIIEGGEPGMPQDAPPQLPETGGVPAVPSLGEPVQPDAGEVMPQDQNLGGDINSPYRQYVPPQVPESGGESPLSEEPVPPGYGVPQNQNEEIDNSPYIPYAPRVPESGQDVPLVPSSGQPLQPESGLGLPQNQIVGDANQKYTPYAPPQMPQSREPLQPQVESAGLPQNPIAGDANQQYMPYAPPRMPESDEPLQPQAESGLPQNPIAGNVDQQYIPQAPPGMPESGQSPPLPGEPLQPEAGLGMPPQDQGMLEGNGNSPYRQYNTAPGYQNTPEAGNAPEGQALIPPVLATGSPIVNSTKQIMADYDTTRTETPDYLGWLESTGSDLYPDIDANGWLDQYYYSDDSENSYYSFNLFGNGDNLNNEYESEQGDIDFESSEGEVPFDPYESMEYESYENMLKQEIEDYKNVGQYNSDVAPKPDSPNDRLQPDLYKNWKIDNSQPSSTWPRPTYNPQAANNFLLYCIPAILITLILYVGYTNWIRKPKIVKIPSGNNWRAEYRDIEAKSKEIEPMLRRAEMY